MCIYIYIYRERERHRYSEARHHRARAAAALPYRGPSASYIVCHGIVLPGHFFRGFSEIVKDGQNTWGSTLTLKKSIVCHGYLAPWPSPVLVCPNSTNAECRHSQTCVIYVCVCIYRYRERETDVCVCVYIYICIYRINVCIYIYMCHLVCRGPPKSSKAKYREPCFVLSTARLYYATQACNSAAP